MLSEKIYTTLKHPVISEKAAIEKSSSNTYIFKVAKEATKLCLLYTSPSPRDPTKSRMPSSA